MTSNVLCKYFMNGACAFGDKCRFSHNRQDEASQVCRYYLQGNCAYGDRCRYEHSKPSWSSRGQPPPPSGYAPPPAARRPPLGAAAGASASIAKLPSGASELGMSASTPNWEDYMTPDEMDEFEAWQLEQEAAEAAEAADGGGGGGAAQQQQQQQQRANGAAGGQTQQGEEEEEEQGDIVDPADIPLCNEYAATGACGAGDDCLYVHGDECEVCGYYCAHPYNPDWTAQHLVACRQAMGLPPAPSGPAGGVGDVTARLAAARIGS